MIRQYLTRFPDERPTALAQKIMDEHKGLKVRGQEVSTIRAKMREQGNLPPKAGQEEERPAEPAASPPVDSTSALADKLARLKEAAQAVGGPEEAKRILDLLK